MLIPTAFASLSVVSVYKIYARGGGGGITPPGVVLFQGTLQKLSIGKFHII